MNQRRQLHFGLIKMRRKAIFIHNPKCAGSSIKKCIATWYPNDIGYTAWNRGQVWVNEQRNRYKRYFIFHSSELDNFDYKFMVVRNPFDRLVSAWLYTEHRRSSFAEYIDRICFLDWNNLCTFEDTHVIPYTVSQSLLFKNGDTTKPVFNFACRFEHLEDDLKTVFSFLNLEPRPLPKKKINQTKHVHYSKYYDDASIDLVKETYAADLEYFDYSFNG